MRPLLRKAWLWLWGGLALTVIVFAVLVSVARLVTPWAAEYQAQVEQHLSDYLGFPVAVGELEVEWHILGPRLRLDDLRTGGADPAQAPARIERAYVDLSLALPSAGNPLPLRIQDVSLVGVRARVELGAGGRPSLAGVELGGADRAGDVVVRRLLGVRSLQLREARITIVQEGREPLELSEVEVRLVNDGVRHRAAARADLPAVYGDELRLAFDLRGPPTDPGRWDGRVYARGADLALGRWLAPWREATRFAARGRGDAELWGRWSGGRLERVQARTALRELVLARDDAPAEVSFRRLAGRFAWSRIESGWRVDAADLAVEREGRAWRSKGFSLARRQRAGETADWRGHFDFARAQDVLALARLMPLPQGMSAPFERVTGGRAIQGDVRALRFHARARDDFAVRATLRDVGWAPGEPIPGVHGLDGDLALQPGGGHLDLTTADARVSAPWLFRGPLPIADLRGRIELARDADGMRLRASDLTVANGDVRAAGRAQLILPADDSGARIDLQADFAEGDAAAVSRYLPAGIMKPDLIDWLDNAFVAGHITDGRLTWRGRVRDFPHDDKDGTFAVDMQVRQGRLNYSPKWPGVLAGAGRVRFEGRSLTVNADQARMFDSRVTDLRVHISNFENAHLKIDFDAAGPLSDLVRVINDSPLQERLGPLFRGAEAAGAAALALNLDIPLRVPEETAVQGSVRLDGASRFAQPRFALALDRLDGRVAFTDDSLRIDGLEARLRGQPVTIDARTQPDEGRPTAIVDLRGTLGSEALLPDLPPWLADRIEGRSPWHIQARVPIEREAERPLIVRGSSDLVGTAVDLPAPLGKPADTEMPLHFELPVDRVGELRRVRFAYGARLQAALGFDDRDGASAITGGRVRLGSGAVPTIAGEPDGVRLRGRVAELDVAAWSALLRAHGNVTSALGDDGGGIVGADLRIDRLLYGGRAWSEVALEASRGEQAWELEIGGPMLAGQALIPRAGGAPERALRLRLKKADLAAARAVREEADAGAPPDPAALPPLDVRVDRLTLPAGVLRQVVLTTTPLADGLAIRRLEFDNPHLSLQGSGYWRGTEQRRTALDLRMRSDDLGAALERFGIEGVIDRTNGRVTAALQWPGSPWSPALGTLEGQVQVRLVDGALKPVDPGIARLLAPFNIQGLLGAGFHVDEIEGRIDLGDGFAATDDLTVEGSVGRLRIRGRSNLVERSFDHTVVYRPELSSSLPLIGMLSGGPAAGLAVALVQGVLRNLGADVESAAEITYRLTGSWDDPTVRIVNTAPSGPGRDPRSSAGDGAQR